MVEAGSAFNDKIISRIRMRGLRGRNMLRVEIGRLSLISLTFHLRS